MSDGLVSTYEKGKDVRYGVVSLTSSGDTTVLAGVAGKKIILLGYTVVCGGATTLTWKSGASTAISGGMPFAANGGAAPDSVWGICETAYGEALVLNSTANVAVGGTVAYAVG